MCHILLGSHMLKAFMLKIYIIALKFNYNYTIKLFILYLKLKFHCGSCILIC